MSLLIALALATAAPATRTCSWDHPGVNPFMGDVVAAVDRYTDIAPETRSALKKRMAARQYDDVVSIKRDSVSGKFAYDPALRSMYFGNGTICSSVSRSKWRPDAEERGLVYCEKSECIIVPTICRNVSRIRRKPGQAYPPAGFLPRSTAVTPVVMAPEQPAPPAEGGGYAPPEGLYPPVAGGPIAPAQPLFPGNDNPGCCRLLPPPPPISGCADCAPRPVPPELLPPGVPPSPIPPATVPPPAGPPTTPPGSLPPILLPPTMLPPSGPGLPPSVVPEPETWSMMAAGLALIAWATRRRRRASKHKAA